MEFNFRKKIQEKKYKKNKNYSGFQKYVIEQIHEVDDDEIDHVA